MSGFTRFMGAIPLIGDLGFNQYNASEDADAAARKQAAAQQSQLDQWDRLEGQLPDLTWNSTSLSGYDAAQEGAAGVLGRPEAAGASADPRAMQAENEALQRLSEIYSSGGLTAADQARLGQVTGAVNAQARGREQAILQNAQARGMGGSGAELAALLSSNQTSAQTGAQMAGDVSRLAEQRALDALSQYGQLGSHMRDQSFGEDFARRQTADAVARFNAEGERQRQARNVAAQNQAREYSTSARNQGTMWNRAGEQASRQQDYENRAGIAGARSDVYGGQSASAERAQAAARARGEAANDRFTQMAGDVVTGGATLFAPAPKRRSSDDEEG